MRRSLILLTGLLWAFTLLALPAQAQQHEATSKMTEVIDATLEQLRRVEAEEQAEALAWAAQRSLPLAVRQTNGRRVLLVGLEARRPTYLSTFNYEAALTTRTATLHPGNQLGLSLTGEGMEIGIWDGGVPLQSHQELTGRITVHDEAAADDHATHVGGTLIARGVRTDARGMAYEAHLRAYDWENDAAEMSNEAARGLLVSNHSYGIIAGWYYGDLEGNGDTWYWIGDPSISEDEDYIFGWYDVEAAQFDRVVFASPYLLPIIAAGNDRSDDGPASGTYRALDGRGNWRSFDASSRPRPSDGGAEGYDSIAGAALAKNVLTVGSIHVRSGSPTVSGFSSFGPTDDGRIKPDLVGYGEHVLSSTSGDPTAYAFSSGTSMATPNVAGSLTLLQQHYANLTGRSMRAATLKGLALHTAADLGPLGPDYKHGWGLLDAEAAAQHLSASLENELAVFEATLEEGSLYSRAGKVTQAGPLRVTLSWTDLVSSRHALHGASSLDDPTPHLRNDLDLRILNETTGEVYLPYTLDPQAPSLPAIPGDNLVDPVEQIYIPHVEPGDYTLIVSHKSGLANGNPQVFAILVSGMRSASRPVSVSHLDADESVDRVQLRWKTQFERGPGHFLIQRALVTFLPGGERVIGAYTQVGRVETHTLSEQVQDYVFEERGVLTGRYRYQVVFDGPDARYHAASIEALVPAPEQFGLVSNYPNPFSDRTQVIVDLPERQHVTLDVYDVLGRPMMLVHDGPLGAGRHALTIEATGWPPGLYLARLATPKAVRSHRMVVTR